MDPTARFAELVGRADGDVPLDEAALLIATHARPDVDVGAGLALLDDMAAGCGDATFTRWRTHVFVELGFTGNTDDYYDPANSFLDEVLHRRVGIPITLAVVGIEVARRLGLAVRGVGMPGHFLLRHDAGDTTTFVDAFRDGQLLDAGECEALFRSLQPPGASFLPSFLDPVGNRAIVARMLANLRAIYTARGDVEALEWVTALRQAVPGISPLERRDLARAYGSAGRFGRAARELEALAEDVPAEAADLLQEAQALRARLN